MRRKILLLLLLFSWLLSACSTESVPTPVPNTLMAPVLGDEESVKVAALAIRSAVAAQAQYGPIVAYLSETLGRPFELVPVGQDAQFTVVEQGEVDFTFNNPLSAVEIRRLYGTEFLVTLSRANTGTEFSALIIARADSSIKMLEDLRGKSATCVDFETAAAGCIFQVFHMQQAGLNPQDTFTSFTETPSQDNIVLGVLNGTFDVGFVRTGQLEKMVAEGTLLNLDEIVIVDQANDDFYYPHTTQLYPEWPIATLSETDPELVIAVRNALLAMPPDHPALVNAGANGFVPAVDYTALDELIVALKLPGWDAQP
jgi:ABC-type phosphate/phosphonate transport system substrate-binding protein